MAKLSPEQATRWLAEQSAIHCKSERQAQFLFRYSTGEYRTLLTAELKKRGFLKDDGEQTNG